MPVPLQFLYHYVFIYELLKQSNQKVFENKTHKQEKIHTHCNMRLVLFAGGGRKYTPQYSFIYKRGNWRNYLILVV